MISLFSLDKQSESVYNKLYILDPFPEETSMFIKDWKKEILTIPNALTLFRLILIPVYVRLYLNASSSSDYLLAGAVLSISCLTDMIDGKIARHFNMISHLGKVLDPLADKMMTITVFVCLSFAGIIQWWVIALIFAKDILLIAGGVKLYKEMSGVFKANVLGKAATVFLVIGGVSILLFNLQSPIYKTIFSCGAIILSLLAFFSYLYHYCKFQKTHDTTQF